VSCFESCRARLVSASESAVGERLGIVGRGSLSVFEVVMSTRYGRSSYSAQQNIFLTRESDL